MTPHNREHLATLDRAELRRMAQDAELGGSWTAQATKDDLVSTLLCGVRMLRGIAVDRNAQPLEGGAALAAAVQADRMTEERSAKRPATKDAAADVAQAIAKLVASQAAPLDEGAVRKIAAEEAERAAAAIEAGGVTIKLPGDVPDRKLEGLAHAILPDVVEAVALTGKALLLGPAGCGKTTLAKQVAATLDRPFYFLSCTGGTSEAQLLGRLLLDGSFLGTPLLTAIETGGVCLLDEADALDPNVTLALNAGVANGSFSVPNRPMNPVAVKHQTFALILAGNDITGGSHLYSGRNQQDAALLDRFAAVTFCMQPDVKLERAIAKSYGEAAEWLAPLLANLRANVEKHRLRRVVSMRLIEHGGALILHDPGRWTRERILARVLAGWTPDEIAKATEGVSVDAF